MNSNKRIATNFCPKFFFLLLIVLPLTKINAQVTIKGTVKDTAQNPLAGASVQVKGAKNGVLTESSGNFSIGAPASAGTLLISYAGFVTQEIPFSGNVENLEIQLKRSIASIDEVVVIGYGKQRKGDITGAVSTVSMNKINDVPITNLSNALAGRAPGMTIINNSGLAGAASSISIRGSFNNPLIVIDGIVKDKAAFDALDPNEIDQFSVLKDAAAASVYGASAGSGVIVITTKRGNIGKPVFSAQVSTTTQRPTQTMLADQASAEDELIYQNRVTQFNNEINNQNTALPNNQATLDYFKDHSYNLNDWIWRNPSDKKYMLSVNGGTDKITYYNMISYTDEKGSYQNLGYKKFNLRSNITAKLSDAISLNLNLAAFQQNTDRFYWPFSSSDDLKNYNVSDFYRTTFNWPHYIPPYLAADGTPASPGEVTPYPTAPDYGGWRGWNVADVVLSNQRYIRARDRQFNPTLTLDIKLDRFIEGLSTKFVGNYEANDFFQKSWLNFSKSYNFGTVPGQPVNYLPAPPNPAQTQVFSFNTALLNNFAQYPFLSEYMSTGWKYQLDWYLNYDRKFGQHSINAMAVFEQTEGKDYNTTALANQPVTTIDQFFAYSQASGARNGYGGETVMASQAWIGRVHYDFASRYIAEFSFREDGRYEFAPGHQWGFFPSGSVAWRISKESFFQNITWVNDLKLRGSYGTTGNLYDVSNNPITPFQFQTYYQNNGGYVFGNNYNIGIGPTATPNPDITWATTINRNLGIDFTLLRNRLSGTFDVFSNIMKNIYGSPGITLPTTYGQTLAPTNYAKRAFHGWEYSLQWQDRIGKVAYGINANMGFAIDKWELFYQDPQYLPGGPQSFRNAIGQPADRIFGYQADGLIRTQDQLNALIASGYTYASGGKNGVPYLGAILYKDIRGQSYSSTPDNRIDGNDVVLLSNNGKPRINYGFGGNASWNGFTIDAHFQGVAMYDVMISNQDGAGIRQWGGGTRLYYPIWAKDVWTPDNPNAIYPRVTGNNWDADGSVGSSFWLRSGAYLRLKNLNIAYSLPYQWVQKAGMLSVQVFVNGTNLLTFSKLKEFQDPEQQNYDSYPIMKTFTAGLNIRF